ncbi:MAG: DUF927 domain-containing protein [Rhodocyclales bacterium]|nr:DUF927 domain-containing protein [Rhodocyclales bacterium]
MKKSDIQRIASAAAAHGPVILDRWLPGGKRQGKEYLVRNPHRDDGSVGSLSVEIATGRGGDFATGEVFGDFVGCVAFALQCGMSEAAEAVAEFIRLPPASTPAPAGPATSPKKTQVDDWSCIMPIPSDAPAAPKAHSKHGKPSTVYPYINEAGEPTGFVYRWDAAPPEHPKKEFAPLTLWRNSAGRMEWRFKHWPPPRPLYWPEFRADVPVIMHEGEKSVMAGRRLLPDFMHACWPSGANAVGKADLRSLEGREVWLWPDHDAPGRGAMVKLAALLRKTGARSVHFINVLLFERLTVNGAGHIINRVAQLPDGWDAADAQEEGWNAESMDHFLHNEDALLERIDGDAEELLEAATDDEPEEGRQSPYVLDEQEGLFYTETEKDGRVRQMRLCGPLSVPALARDDDGGSWGAVIEFRDRDGKRRREVVAYRLFLGDSTDGIKTLVDMGLETGTSRSCLDRLRTYIISAKPSRRARLVDQPGWHDRAFVLPDASIGETDETLLYRGNKRALSAYTTRGTLGEWQTNIAFKANNNPRLMFCLAVAFSGPLLKVIGAASAVFHWYGDSSIGKSGALVAAGSVWGPAEGQVHSWRSTDNALESVAALHNHCVLILDELKEVDPKIASAIVYMLINARGKGRAHHAGGLREQVSWHISGMSSGELGMSDLLAGVGQKHHAGQMVRFIEIAADAGAGYGMWNDVGGLVEGGKAFTDTLKKMAGRYHGTAGRAFVAELCKRLDAIPQQWRAHDLRFSEDYKPTNAGGQVQRVLGAFSLVAFAGELATEWGIVPWARGQASQAAGMLFEEWLKERPTKGNSEDAQIVAHVRGVLERTWQSKFVDWHRTTEEKPDLSRMAAVHDSLGFRKRDVPFDELNPAYYFYITRSRFAEEFATKGGFKAKRVAALLKQKGVLRCDADGTTLRETLPNGDPRAYCIIGSKLWNLE